VAAGEFFRGLLATALGAGEILTAVEVPPQPPAWGFAEVARRPGDFALAGVAAVLAPRPGERGHCEGARVVGFGLADRPARLRAVEAALVAGPLDAAALARAAQLAPGDSDPPDDVHASAEYRGHLASVLAERVLVQALGRLGAAA
jgi:carbon-monoxide dehydrogenase medium subunit